MLQQCRAGGPASGRPCDCHEQQRRTHRRDNLISFFKMVNSGFKLWSLDNKLDSESKSFTGTNVMCHTDIRWLGEPQSGHISHFTTLTVHFA